MGWFNHQPVGGLAANEVIWPIYVGFKVFQPEIQADSWLVGEFHTFFA